MRDVGQYWSAGLALLVGLSSCAGARSGTAQAEGAIVVSVREGTAIELAPPILGVAVGRSGFSDVVKALGPAEAVSAAEGGPVRLCYGSDAANDSTTLIFSSGGPGGFGSLVSSYSIEAAVPVALAGRCPRSPRVRRDLSLPGGVLLGMPRAVATSKLGADAKALQDGLELTRTWMRAMTDSERATITAMRGGLPVVPAVMHGMAGTTLSFSDDRVVRIEVHSLEEF